MLRISWTILLFVFSAALQTVISPKIAVFGVKPDLLLILVVIWGMVRGGREGALAGLAAGFLEDILSASFYIHSVTKAVSGFLAWIIRGNFAVDSGLIHVITVSILAPLSYCFELLAFYFFFGRALPSAYSVFSVVVISAFYNALLTLLLFRAISMVIARLRPEESGQLEEFKLYRL